jgi:hypothetical protein
MKSNFCVAAAFLFLVLNARAQTTAFTYQGQLISSNAPATGNFDLRFQIYNTNGNVVAGPLTNAPVGVTNGLFNVTLDFGASVFDGSARSLGIGVRSFNASTNVNTNAYVVLSPRQTLTSVPYAIQSLNALNASNAVVLTMPLPATNMVGTIPNSLLSPNVAVLTNNVIFSGSVSATNFAGNGYGLSNVPGTSLIGVITGNGSGLSGVPANSLTGTLPNSLLSPNVAILTNNVIFSGTVSAVNFSGGGRGLTNVPGAFTWVTVAANTQAQPNVGYICNNDVTPVTITLPSLPGVGDVYKVAGVGAGGWIIAQNANQMIAAGNLSDSVGQSWKAGNSSLLNWSAIASSAYGANLVATANNGYIWTSANSGTTWTVHNSSPVSSAMRWSSVASSANGANLVATVGYTSYYTSGAGQIYTSIDSGASWTARAGNLGSLAWSSVASSADGIKLVAAVYGTSASAGVYTSIDSGATWTLKYAALYCTAVASSADGTKLVATLSSGTGQGIYTSASSGAAGSWLQRTNLGSCTAVASSTDGSRLVATTSSGQIYISTDSGATWIAQNTPVTGQISSVASSSDGSMLAITTGGSSGSIYASSDSGATWRQLAGAPAGSWAAIASSADGSQLAAAVYGGKIYVSSQSSTTTGPTGYLFGPQHSAIELIYAGNYLFLPLSHEGTIRAY